MESNRNSLIWAAIGIAVLAVLVAFILLVNQPDRQIGVGIHTMETDELTATPEAEAMGDGEESDDEVEAAEETETTE